MPNQEMILKPIEMLMTGGSETKSVESQKVIDKGRYIVIGNRGNIVVGDLKINGSTGYLSNASVIRKWGTENGLGQLALNGSTSETVLDPCGDFEFEMLTTCGMIPVKSDF